MTKKIQIISISQAIELLQRAKQEYRELEAENLRLRQENTRIQALIPSKSKMPEGFEQLFKGFRK